MPRSKGAYEVVTIDGDKHVFPSLESRSKFISENMHLFGDLPLLQVKEKKDAINPSHYKDRKYEVIDVMQDTMSKEQFIGYLAGCSIKYIMRYDKKDNPLQDLQKCKWYLEKLIETIEEETQCCG
jgi:hypothetical protein